MSTLLLVPLLALAFAACGGAGGPLTYAGLGGATPPPAPTVSLTANPEYVTSGESSMLTWSSTNATSCSASGAWSGATATSGNLSIGPLTASSTYSLTCTGPTGIVNAWAGVTVSGMPPPPPAPTVSLSANPTSVASSGASMLTWSSTNATSCASSGAWGVGAKALSNSTGQSTGPLTTTSAFILACNGTGGTASASATVTVTTPTYTTNFDLTENPISEGGVWHRANNAWTNVRTANGIAFGTDGLTDQFDDSYALLSGFGPDQQAEAVVFRSPDQAIGVPEVELLLRFSDDANNARGYECNFNYIGGVQVVRWNGALGDITPLTITGGAGGLGRNLMTGDVTKATIVGNLISVYINGMLMGQATDSTFATGQPGIGFFIRQGGNNTNLGLTSYSVSSN